jgi:ATP-dependent Clp protease, protease subunit
MLHKFKADANVFIGELDELIKVPVIIRINEFSEDAAKKFATEFSTAQTTSQSIIPIIIDSSGGCVYSLFSMVDAIEKCPLPVATIVEGKAMSAAAALLASGTTGHRYISKRSTVMIHDVSSEGWPGRPEELKADAYEAERLNNVMYEILDTRSKKDSGYYWDLLKENGRADLYLSAEDALGHGLVDHIGVPSLITTVTVKHKLVF